MCYNGDSFKFYLHCYVLLFANNILAIHKRMNFIVASLFLLKAYIYNYCSIDERFFNLLYPFCIRNYVTSSHGCIQLTFQ